MAVVPLSASGGPPAAIIGGDSALGARGASERSFRSVTRPNFRACIDRRGSDRSPQKTHGASGAPRVRLGRCVGGPGRGRSRLEATGSCLECDTLVYNRSRVDAAATGDKDVLL